MTEQDTVSILKHMDDKLVALKELVVILEDNHKVLHDKEERARDKALDISIAEVNRRLDLLNGEASRLVSMQNTYLPRELFNSQHEEFRREIDALRLFEANIQGKIVAYASVISLAIGIVTFVIDKVWK